MSKCLESRFEGSSDPKDDDITDLLPDTFDLGYDEEFDDFVKSSETTGLRTEMKSRDREISGMYGGSMMSSLNLHSMPSNRRVINTRFEPPKSYDRPVQWFSPSTGLRLPHQLR